MRLQTIAGVIMATIVVGVIAAVGLWWWKHTDGMEVRLQNAEQVPLYFVSVRVTGDVHFVGSVAPGDTISVQVEPTGESSITASFTTSDGHELHGILHGYVEPGYSGWVSGQLTRSGIERVDNHIHYSLF